MADVDHLDCDFVLDAFAEIHQEEDEKGKDGVNYSCYTRPPFFELEAVEAGEIRFNTSSQIEA